LSNLKNARPVRPELSGLMDFFCNDEHPSHRQAKGAFKCRLTLHPAASNTQTNG
jgi:hypothetical protein